MAPVQVHRLPADAVVAGTDGFPNSAGGRLDQLAAFKREGLLPSEVGGALLGQGAPFSPPY